MQAPNSSGISERMTHYRAHWWKPSRISVKWVRKDNHTWQPSAKTCSYINSVSSCSDPKLESSRIVQMRKLSNRRFFFSRYLEHAFKGVILNRLVELGRSTLNKNGTFVGPGDWTV